VSCTPCGVRDGDDFSSTLDRRVAGQAEAPLTVGEPDTLKAMSGVATEKLIERGGRVLIDAAV
jgi:hypothetical protein